MFLDMLQPAGDVYSWDVRHYQALTLSLVARSKGGFGRAKNKEVGAGDNRRYLLSRSKASSGQTWRATLLLISLNKIEFPTHANGYMELASHLSPIWWEGGLPKLVTLLVSLDKGGVAADDRLRDYLLLVRMILVFVVVVVAEPFALAYL